MNGTKKLIYWDSCIFISWLKNEQRPDPKDMVGVIDTIERLKRREVTLITSTITQTEIAACNVGQLVMPLLDDLMKRKNIQRLSVDIKISQMARTLRDFYQNEPYKLDKDGNKIGSKTLSVPDAIHLATAILHKADVFHTFDASDKKGNLGLIPLNGNVAGHNLRVEKPNIDQFRFDFMNKINHDN